MIDHIVLTVQSYEKSKAFYLKALKPLGYGLVNHYGAFVLDPDGNNVEAVINTPE